jgi:hypothetical protein
MLTLSFGALLAMVVSAGEPIEQRPPQELRKAVHAALRASAPARRPDAAAMVPQLVELFNEVRANERMVPDDQSRYQGLLRARLQTLSKELKKQLPLERPAHVAIPADKGPPVLAQQAAGAANRQNGNAFNVPNAANAGAGRDITSANAQSLIDLIETTIAPTTWQRAGGQGTIRYYRPLRVLVIRQTGEIHDQLGGLLQGVR